MSRSSPSSDESSPSWDESTKEIHVVIAPGDQMEPLVEVSSACVSGSQSSSSKTEGRLAETEETKKVVRFTAAQRAYMNAYYSRGMRGTGKRYIQVSYTESCCGCWSNCSTSEGTCLSWYMLTMPSDHIQLQLMCLHIKRRGCVCGNYF